MDLIDRLRTYASTRNGELAELITEAADALERPTCEDAVSRADVIELVKDSYYNLEESIKDTWAMVADVEALPAVQPLVIHCTDCEDWLERQSILGVTISELPSAQSHDIARDIATIIENEKDMRVILKNAQPDAPDTNGGDIIYRQAAIDALESIGSLDTEADKKYARSVFEALPSVQPKRTEKRTETHACDCISRQRVLKILTDISYNHCPTAQASEAVDLAKTMVAVMPETNVHDLQKGADCISRQAAIELAMQYCPDDDGSCSKADRDIRELLDDLENLPSAQPERKTGRWIERNPQNSPDCRLIECSECGNAYIVGYNIDYDDWIDGHDFCMRCGADLRGGSNGKST